MTNTLGTLAAMLTLAQSAFAHDPAEHEKEAAAAKADPDCTAMKNRDHSKMDMNDPVMKAMMSRCAATPKKAADPKTVKGRGY